MLSEVSAREVMTTSPKCLSGDISAEAALELLNDLKISAAFVVEDNVPERLLPVGIIHLHDFVRIGLG